MFLSINTLQISNLNAKPSPNTSTSLLSPIHFSLHFSRYPSKTRIRCSIPDPKTLPQSAIQRIADKLRSLGITENDNSTPPNPNPQTSKIGEIFIPVPNRLPKHRVGHTLDPSWSTPENPVPRPGSSKGIVSYNELRRKVRRERKEQGKEEKVPSLAELSLPQPEMRRLRAIGMAERRKLKVGKAGITEGIVNGIHERWRRAEVVKIVCEDLCRQNMKRTHELLEKKTGGLVVWRSGSKIILYRGTDYKYPYFLLSENSASVTTTDAAGSINVDDVGTKKIDTKDVEDSSPRSTNRNSQTKLVQGVGAPSRVRFQLPGEAQLAEEADRLLDGLGPRFTDWWGYDPLPVDADLLPAVVPGYRKPFRLLPYGIKAKLTDDELTTLRRLGRPLPCHFALGRNRKLQGLAALIVKLWEKCEIAKIAVKRGIQNTNSELMAEELKWLTGGTVLSRDREFIVLYRGKDFLPSAVSSAIEERRKNATDHIKHPDHDMGEFAEEFIGKTVSRCLTDEASHSTNTGEKKLFEQRKLSFTEAAIQQTNLKLSRAIEKKVCAEKLLADVEKNEMTQKPDLDKEGITEEERYMLRKVGLKMKAILLMGRRGVFDGTIENMHLHWKYRELVKILCKETNIDAVHQVAQNLESESGGILVAVERVSKGYVIIVYRGKNYTRPACLRPATLLSKREALKRSLEAQRRESLKLHILKLAKNINELKLQLERDKASQSLPSIDDMNAQAGDKYVADPISTGLSDDLNAPSEDVQPALHVNVTVASSVADANRESESSSESEVTEGCDSHITDINVRALSSHLDNNKSVEEKLLPSSNGDGMCKDKAVASTAESANDKLKESISSLVKEDNKVNSKVVRLSNRDRLLLRKQALKMKKRPVLAVGRSNIVTGVAKAIKTHFKKHPLAIVNVKGRAKGTSVQELVFKLEQATGAVLVSQEPNKVILYRGWGVDEEQGNKGRKTRGDLDNGAKTIVSAELIAAIRLECGLLKKQKENPVPSAEM